MNKPNKIITITAAVVALVAVVGLSVSTYAQNDDNAATATPTPGQYSEKFQMSDEQRAEFDSKREAMRKAMDEAIAGGYSDWVEAVKTYHGIYAPILEEVNENNFNAFKEAHGYMREAHTLMDKADSTLEAAGIQRQAGHMGGGMGCGGKMGGGRMMR